MKIFILFGQTATGKTAKALKLAENHNGEIINFDSRQIYKNLNIVTGKDIPLSSKLKVKSLKQKSHTIGYYELSSLNFQHSTRLWLYDIIEPKDIFSSADYVECANYVIKDILSRGKTPILVGGTGYYLRHLLWGTPNIIVKENWDLRKKLETKTVTDLQKLLENINPTMLSQMNNSDRNNPRRLIRRIEIAESGSSLPDNSSQQVVDYLKDIPLSFMPFFHPSTDAVGEVIARRVDDRLLAGAVAEVKGLLEKGYSKNDPGLNAIGYQQLISYINKEISLDEAKKQWVTKEVQYAKRQKTFFKKILKI